MPADERPPADTAENAPDSDAADGDAADDTHDGDAPDDGMGSDDGMGKGDANADGIEAAISGEDGLGDPRDGLQDPAENVPTPEVPDIAPDAPDAPEPDSVPEGLRAEFWELVFAANVALFGLSLGAMLVAFDENVSMGVLSLVVGALAAVFLAYRYLNRQHTP